MHRLVGLHTFTVLLILLAAPLHAEAAIYPWEGTLSLRSAGLPDLVATGSGVATVNGSGGGAALSTLQLAGGIAGAATIAGTGSAVQSIRASLALGSGTFAPGQGAASGFGGPLPLNGSLRYCLVVGCGTSIDFPLTDVVGLSATTPFIATRTAMTTMGATTTTTYGATGARWAVGGVVAAAPTGLTTQATGFVHTPASGTNVGSVAAGGTCTSKYITNFNPPYWKCTNDSLGKTCARYTTRSGCLLACSCSSAGSGNAGFAVTSFANLAAPGARIALVTPLQTITSGTAGSRPFAATLDIRLVPEPGVLAALAAGIGAIAVVGWLGRGRRARSPGRRR